ncbi:MAG: hypothetical protein A2Z66_10990 [Chloroflexi bacterium RBG_13_66_10]|nr:MAG: hypothetical protein A2Z66_10990 [Chloroflexi bacterium RBG_13_66_10]
MRKCDFCGQEIQDEAVFCRHCRRELPRSESIAGKKRCIYCAEWIERGAILCTYCGHELVPSGSIGRVYRPDRPEAAPRTWDPRDVFRAQSVPPFAPEGEAEGERRGVFGRLGIGRHDERPPEPAPAPLRASSPPEEPPTGPRPGLFRRLVTPKETGVDASRPRPTEPRKIAWGAEPRPPEGPLSPRLFAASPERLEDLPPVRQGIPWGRLLGVVLVIGIVGFAFIAISGGWLRGFDPDGLLQGVAPPPSTSAPEAPTAIVETTAPLLPGPSPTAAPTNAAGQASSTPYPTADCLSWDRVTVANEGQTLCVFGEVAGRSVTADFPILIYFSSEPGAFIIVDRTSPHPEVDPGVCVMVIGEVEVMSRVRPVIDAQGEILFCQ